MTRFNIICVQILECLERISVESVHVPDITRNILSHFLPGLAQDISAEEDRAIPLVVDRLNLLLDLDALVVEAFRLGSDAPISLVHACNHAFHLVTGE